MIERFAIMDFIAQPPAPLARTQSEHGPPLGKLHQRVDERNRDFTYINCYLSRLAESRSAFIGPSAGMAQRPAVDTKPSQAQVSENQCFFFARLAG